LCFAYRDKKKLSGVFVRFRCAANQYCILFVDRVEHDVFHLRAVGRMQQSQ
jgi:hypothetical protein